MIKTASMRFPIRGIEYSSAICPSLNCNMTSLDQTGESYVPVHGRFQLHLLIEILHSFHDSTLLGLSLYFFYLSST